MPGKLDHEDYDDYEEEYEDDYDDAVDDWEVEAAEEEEKAKAEATAKEALAEKKLQTRAPAAARAAAEAEEEEADALPDDVMREVEALRQVATDVARGADLVGSDSTELLCDAPTTTIEDMRALGTRAAEHLLSFAEAPNFETVLVKMFESLGKEFKSVPGINDSLTRAEKALDASRKSNKAAKKKKHDSKGHASRDGDDGLNMDVDDKGGAYVEDGDAFF